VAGTTVYTARTRSLQTANFPLIRWH